MCYDATDWDQADILQFASTEVMPSDAIFRFAMDEDIGPKIVIFGSVRHASSTTTTFVTLSEPTTY